MKRLYCTYFNSAYFSRGAAMLESLRRHEPGAETAVLALDDGTADALRELKMPGVCVIDLPDLLQYEERLAACRAERTPAEFCFTVTPQLVRMLMNRCPAVDELIYLDADLFFFASPAPLHDLMGDGLIGIIPHDFSPAVAGKIDHGIYNVSWNLFRRSAPALACLDSWSEQCLNWCFARLEGDRYADQKYLDRWPSQFDGVVELRLPGANLAPWNQAHRRLRWDGAHVTVDGEPLIFYHFSSFLRARGWLYNTNLSSWKTRAGPVLRRHVIEPYVAALQKWDERAPAQPEVPGSVDPGSARSPARMLRTLRHIGLGLLKREYLLVIRGRVI